MAVCTGFIKPVGLRIVGVSVGSTCGLGSLHYLYQKNTFIVLFRLDLLMMLHILLVELHYQGLKILQKPLLLLALLTLALYCLNLGRENLLVLIDHR